MKYVSAKITVTLKVEFIMITCSTSCSPFNMNPYCLMVASRNLGTRQKQTIKGRQWRFANCWAYINAQFPAHKMAYSPQQQTWLMSQLWDTKLANSFTHYEYCAYAK